MNKPTSWYYASHKKEAFPNQQKLCKAVEWTTCNLEGKELKSPTVLSATWGNPLTIRLLALDEALKHFDNFKKTEEKIKELSREKFINKQPFMISHKWEADDSPLNTMGAPIDKIEGLGEDFELRYIDIHLALYEFLTNFGSIIDRLTYEINMLYNLGIRRQDRYWKTLVNAEKNYLSILKGKDKDLADLLAYYVPKFEIASSYRNRMVHDGIIKVEVDSSIASKAIVLLAEDPNDNNSPMNRDAIKFCMQVKNDILKLLDGSYELILQHLRKNGNPPW